MSAEAALDLSGTWRGIFNCPHSVPPTEFEAIIQDAGGALVGSIREANLFTGEPLDSTLHGQREGLQVRFTKFYETDDEDYDTVLYEGSVAVDGLEIHGRWDIPGDWSGTFIMVRANATAAIVEAETAETSR